MYKKRRLALVAAFRARKAHISYFAVTMQWCAAFRSKRIFEISDKKGVYLEMKFLKEVSDNVDFRGSDYVYVKETGNIVRVRKINGIRGSCPILRIDGDRYVLKETGEIFYFEKGEKKGGSLRSLFNTFQRIRDLVNCNCVNDWSVRWVTLTYAENMTDSKRLYRDYMAFWKRFLRYLDRRGSPHPVYIAVAEPQGRGAWHLHIFFIWLKLVDGYPIFLKAPYVANSDLRGLWRQGFVKITAVKDCDNLGAYLSAYLCDVEYSGDLADRYKGFDIVEKGGKRFIKGARIDYYPKRFNILRHSRNILVPVTYKASYKNIKKVVGAVTPTYQKSVELTEILDNGEEPSRTPIRIKISDEYYNVKNLKESQ